MPSHVKDGKKKAGRKAIWSDNTLDDFIDIITSNEYYKKKLIFTNSKNQKNGIIDDKVLSELRKRCEERKETVKFTIPQMRNKFKKCISECKHAAMTIKTATGIKRFEDDKGYGAWFKQLFPLVQSRDSCQPDLAVEPSCSSSNSTCSTSCNDADEDEPHDPRQQPDEVKLFVPLKKKKLSAKDHVGEAVALLKTMVENDPAKELIRFMQDEADKSRKHELEMTKLLINATTAPTQLQERGNDIHSWPPYQMSAPNFQHHSRLFQSQHMPTQGFAEPACTQTYSNVGNCFSDDNGKSYHKL